MSGVAGAHRLEVRRRTDRFCWPAWSLALPGRRAAETAIAGELPTLNLGSWWRTRGTAGSLSESANVHYGTEINPVLTCSQGLAARLGAGPLRHRRTRLA